MRKYKINRNKERKLPPHAVTDKFKDFDKIRMQYNDITKRSKLPLYKNKKLFLLILLIGLIAWLIAESFKEGKKKESSKETIDIIEKKYLD